MTEPTAPHLIRLPMYAFLTVTGARAIEFLQGQLSCDMREARADRALSGAWCSVKGRVLANFLVWAREPDCVILRLRADLASQTATALRRYAALSRVVVEAAQPDYRCVGLLGANAAKRAAAAFEGAPSGRLSVFETGAGSVIVQRDEQGALCEAWLPDSAAGVELERQLQSWPRGCEEDWKRALIGQQLADVQAATREQHLPQMLGYDADGTVNFRKGCYTGQEIIARTHYKGSVKRVLATLHGGPGPFPAPGADLVAAERVVGSVIECATTHDGGVSVLAVLGHEQVEAGTVVRTAEGLELRPAPANAVL